jgi:hypothetical protein
MKNSELSTEELLNFLLKKTGLTLKKLKRDAIKENEAVEYAEKQLQKKPRKPRQKKQLPEIKEIYKDLTKKYNTFPDIVINPLTGRNIKWDGKTVDKLYIDGYVYDSEFNEWFKLKKKPKIPKKKYTALTHLFTRIGEDDAKKFHNVHKDGRGFKYIHFMRAGMFNVTDEKVLNYVGKYIYDYNEDEFIELKNILREDENYNSLMGYRESYIHLIIIGNVQSPNKEILTTDYNPLLEELAMGESENAIYNSYIKYGLNENAESFGDLFNIKHSNYIHDNFKKNACFVNAIIDAYRPYFDRDKKKLKSKYGVTLTYDFLIKLCKIETKNDTLPLTIKKSIDFFKYFRLGIVVIGAFGCIEYFKPEKMNNDISPSTLYLYVQNGHVHLINDKMKHLQQVKFEKMKIPDDETFEEVKNVYVSNKYNICKKENENYIFVDDMKGLMSEIKKIDKQKLMNVIYSNDLTKLLFEMIENKYYPSVTFGDNRVKGLTMKIEDTIINICDNIIRAKNTMDTVLNNDEYNGYIEAFNEFYNGVITYDNMSRYNGNTLKIENEYKMRPLTGIFNGKCNKERTYTGLDTRKAYTSDFIDIENYPVYNYFDVFIKYDGSEIKDENEYIVKCDGKKPEELILFGSVYNRCYGYKLNRIEGIEYEILYYRKPSKLVISNSKELVNTLWDKKLSNIEENDQIFKKSIVNIILGKMEKKKNTKKINKLFKNYDEAFYYQNKYGGNIYCICDENEEVAEELNEIIESGINMVYLLVIDFEKELINGFSPIKNMVYEIRSLKNYQTYMKLKKNGIEAVGIHTDSLLFDDVHIKKVEELFNTKVNKIGGYKLEKNKYLVGNVIVKNSNELIDIDELKIIENDIKDEYDTEEINKIIENGNTLVKGKLPGCGKTYACTHYKSKKSLIISPYNTLVQHQRENGNDSITLNKLVGIGVNQNVKNTPYDVTGYDTVIFDEIFLYGVDELSMIVDFIENHKDVKILATGDCDQLEPVNFYLNNVGNQSEYLSRCINQIFKNQMTLKENKRLKTKADKKKLENIREDIFNYSQDIMTTFKKYHFKIINKMEDVKTINNICYFNFRCNKVNEHIHKNVVEKKKGILINGINYYKGLNLICKQHYKSGKGRLYTNYKYVIQSINEEKFKILEPVENETFTFDISMLKYFKLPYSRTCHSVQGLTITDNFTIFDTNTPYINRKWLWTAISRTDDFKKIQIFEHDYNEIVRLTYAKKLQYYKMKVQGYKTQDKKAGRIYDEKEYINERWIMNELTKNNYCSGCKHPFILCLGVNEDSTKSNITVDRIDNNLPHIINNCHLLCLSCNRKKK